MRWEWRRLPPEQNERRKLALGESLRRSLPSGDAGRHPLPVPPRRLFGPSPVQTAPDGGKGGKPLQRRVEEAHRAAERAALHVVIGRRELDEALEKLLDVRLRDQPDRLPRLVRFPELAPVEVADAGEEVRFVIGFGQRSLRCSTAAAWPPHSTSLSQRLTNRRGEVARAAG